MLGNPYSTPPMAKLNKEMIAIKQKKNNKRNKNFPIIRSFLFTLLTNSVFNVPFCASSDTAMLAIKITKNINIL
jgi:hypothetical protein